MELRGRKKGTDNKLTHIGKKDKEQGNHKLNDTREEGSNE